MASAQKKPYVFHALRRRPPITNALFFASGRPGSRLCEGRDALFRETSAKRRSFLPDRGNGFKNAEAYILVLVKEEATAC
jgi:hypothetical protein